MRIPTAQTFAVAVCIVILGCGTYAFAQDRQTCAPAGTAGATFGASGAAVRTLQQCLIDGGYSIPAGATGFYGEQTRAAVRAFYKAKLNMASWHGSWVGPQGRSALAQLGTVPGGTGSTAKPGTWRRLANASDLARYVAERNKAIENSATGAVPPPMPLSPTADDAGRASGAAALPERFSGTNVQVAGVDEPDLVKTDGTHLYIGHQPMYGIAWPIMREGAVDSVPRPVPPPVGTSVASTPRTLAPATVDAMPPLYRDERKTSIVRTFPLESLNIASKSIEEHGELLLDDKTKTLLILGVDRVTAYDVKNPASPKRTWTYTHDTNTGRMAARLVNGTLYLVMATDLGGTQPCPLGVLRKGDARVMLPCTDIWVPGTIEPVDTTYTVLAMSPASGTVTQKLSLAGERSNVVTYMTEDALYLAHRAEASRTEVYLDFYERGLTDMLGSTTIARIRTIRGYDISPASKLYEVRRAVEERVGSMGADEQMRWRAELENKQATYLKARARDLDRTVVTRIPLASLTIGASGSIPGHLLNQFSLDEHEGYLRAAVTVGDRWGETEQVNDVYVLDSALRTVGSIRDLGLSEQVYAARFIGDRGYLVTFRQIDPFYVLDLSVPTAPKMQGELKIPGYSSYLEPLGNDLVLGVGREGSSVKLSVFDVSNPQKPTERAKYSLKDSWTEVEQNHHAFLRDAKHGVFFIPTGQGGYVFSYTGGALALKATIASPSVKRAVFIDDYLYIVSDDKVVVLDENTWKKVKELAL